MRLADEPIEKFYPICVLCGEKIDGDGYILNGDWYCEDCVEARKADGYIEAENRRESAFENAQEQIYG